MQQYTELSIEERAVIQVSLSMGISQQASLKNSSEALQRSVIRNKKKLRK